MPTSNRNIKHVTNINAPIEVVWKALVDIDAWEWNKWTRLEAKEASEGTRGKLRASYEGDGEWETFDFTFGEVDSVAHILNWKGSVGPFGCLFTGNHVMRLENIVDDDGSGLTRLIHTETFGGLLPALGMGLPYKILDRNYLLMNESLKKFVEVKSGL